MTREIQAAKQLALAALAAVGSVAAQSLGGWDAALQTFLCCMVVDYVSGTVVAGVFQHSRKSESGALDSRAGFRGLCKKGAELLLVLVAAQLDQILSGGAYARTAVLLFLTTNEGLSILENLGLMGVPYPAFLRSALEVLQKQGDRGKSTQR